MTDGMHLKWDVVAHGREVMQLGCMAINSLRQLVPAGPEVLRNERDELRPELAHRAAATSVRAFHLDATCEMGRVLLLLGTEGPNSWKRAQVWFQDGSCALSLLANSFSEYVRLLMLHLGLPGWQYAYTEAGLDPTCRQWLRLMAPDRLAPSSSSSPRGKGAFSCGKGAFSCGGSGEGGGGEEMSASMLLGNGWGGGACAPPGGHKPQPAVTRWVHGPSPSHGETVSMLSLSSLQRQQEGAGGNLSAVSSGSRPSSACAAGGPRAAIALLSGGVGSTGGAGSSRPSCSRNSSSASTTSSSAASSGGGSTSGGGGGGAPRPTGGVRGRVARVRKMRNSSKDDDGE